MLLRRLIDNLRAQNWLAVSGELLIRYVRFVEDQVLPGIISEDDIFYDAGGQL